MAVLVNDEKIDPAEIEAEVQRLQPHYEAHVQGDDATGEAGPRQLREWATENVVERTLVRQAAWRLPVEIPQAEIDAACEEIPDCDEDVKEQVELNMRIDRLMAANVAEVPEPTEQDLLGFYEENSQDMMGPDRVHASHIVKHFQSRPEMEAAYKAILDVKMALVEDADFADMAARHSDCPEDGGDLGWFARGQMVEDFEDVVFAMQPGEVSDVFLTQFGYHIVKLQAREDGELIPLDELRDQIAEELRNRRRAGAVEAFIDSLKEKATIVTVPDE